MANLRKVVHTFAKTPIKRANPTVDGGQIETSYGYIWRKTMFLLWCSVGDIEGAISSEEGNGGYVRDGDYRVSYSINPQLQIYDVECNFVKYTAT